MRRILSTMILAVLALFYGHGAVLRGLTMAGQTGFDWAAAPLRWQVLDMVYLPLGLAVAGALVFRPPMGVVLLWIAALGQILLYTVFRDWVLDVPPAFLPTGAQQARLDRLVWFHAASILAAGAALWLRRRQAKPVA